MELRLTAVDAQTHWMSAKIPNDQYLLYVFDGTVSRDEAEQELLRRARGVPAMSRCVRAAHGLRYPTWVRRDVRRHQLRWHAGELDWPGCLDAVAALAHGPLDLEVAAWRLHVFGSVTAAPGCAGVATVAVLQIGHALADGQLSSEIAAALFGRDAAALDVIGASAGFVALRGIAAARAMKELERETLAGLIPAAARPRPPLSTNGRPGEERVLRTILRPRAELAHPTVTTHVLAAVATALSGYLSARGEDTSSLGAEVPMAKAGRRLANNHFRNVGVSLHADAAQDARAGRIAAELADRRRRGAHPAWAAGDSAVAAVPAPLLRWGVRRFDVDAQSEHVAGNTVVSSVNRGAADLSLAGRRVVFTAGYPGLSPMMGLTHGAHGIGDTVAISVHAATSVLADVDEYIDRIEAALRVA